MTWTIIAVLIAVGFLFLLLEVLVLPGTNIAGVVGFVLLAIGIWQVYAVFGGLAGTITLICTLLLSVVALYFALKSKTWNKAALHKNIDGKVNVVDVEKIKTGDKGKTVSRLAPMGKAEFAGEFYEVNALGQFIDPEIEIEIVKIENNKITVKKT
jgi:membrane-bound ClpP family serine protease